MHLEVTGLMKRWINYAKDARLTNEITNLMFKGIIIHERKNML